jgi:hypothetical protein
MATHTKALIDEAADILADVILNEDYEQWQGQ